MIDGKNPTKMILFIQHIIDTRKHQVRTQQLHIRKWKKSINKEKKKEISVNRN